MITSNKRLIIISASVLSLLLIPIIAMQFSTQVDWSPFDFLIMGVLLLGTGLASELILRKVKGMQPRIIFIVGIIAIFFLIWAELAVGIFGTIFAGS